MALVCLAGLGVGAANAQATDQLAYVGGSDTATACDGASFHCSLYRALQLAAAGDTVVLESTSGAYYGNWSISTAGTGASNPITIAGVPGNAPGGQSAPLDGNGGNSGGCTTAAGCSGPVLTITNTAYVVIKHVTIQNGNDAVNGQLGNGGPDSGAGIENANGGRLTITDSALSSNQAFYLGGAIDDRGGGSATITDSTFTANKSYIAGAIEQQGGALNISGSTFSGNGVSSPFAGAGGYGGALDASSGSVTVSGSTFTNNTASAHGGAIDSFSGTLSVSGSTFTGNSAGGSSPGLGGAIDNGDGGQSTLTVSGSTFSANSAWDGGAIDNADGLGLGGAGTLTALDSTFTDNTATADGGAIDNADSGDFGTATVADSTFSGDHAGNMSAIADSTNGSSPGQVFAAGNLFAGDTCYPQDGSRGALFDDEGYNVGIQQPLTCLRGYANGKPDLQIGSVGALKLGSLASNGGSTQTITLGAGSPAIGLIPNPTTVKLNGVSVNLCPGIDQRGVARPGGTKGCDPGAFESPAPTVQVGAPTQGARYAFGQSVSSSFRCTDSAGAPGISACADQHGHASGSAVDTSTAGTHTFSVTATSKDGYVGTLSVTYTVAAPIPVLSALRLSVRSFRAAAHGPTLGTSTRTGTTISYNDTLRATATLTVLRCTAKNSGCTRLKQAGSFTHRDQTGANTLHFTGRLGGKRLRPGRYQLRITATLAGQTSTPIGSSFRVR